MYKARPYLLFELEEGKTLLQNNTSTVVLSNKQIVQFLMALEQDKSLLNSADALSEFFQNNTHQVITFMLANGIIYKEEVPALAFKNVHIVSNLKIFSELFYKFSAGVFDNVYTVDIDLSGSNITEDDLCIVFLNPFELGEFEKLMGAIHKTNCIVKAIFCYNHSIYMANYHKPSWKNPCPKCFFYSLEAQLRGKGTSHGGMNFQTLVDVIYLKDIKFNAQAILEPYHLLGVINTLFNQLTHIRSFGDDVNLAHDFKLETGTVNADYTYHWEMCDCYE